MWVARMKRFISAAARDHLTLVPAISIGRRAARIRSIALRTSSRSGESRRGAGPGADPAGVLEEHLGPGVRVGLAHGSTANSPWPSDVHLTPSSGEPAVRETTVTLSATMNAE